MNDSQPSSDADQALIAARNTLQRYGISSKEVSAVQGTVLKLVVPHSVPEFSDLFSATGFSTMSSFVRFRAIDYTITACIPLIYGFLHLLTLHAQFPTMIERDLWRVASVVVMSSGAFDALFGVIKDVCFNGLALSGSSRTIVSRCFHMVVYRIIPFFYLLGSGYLLVESIRQLWYLPHDAYVVASWSYYIPHWL